MEVGKPAVVDGGSKEVKERLDDNDGGELSEGMWRRGRKGVARRGEARGDRDRREYVTSWRIFA